MIPINSPYRLPPTGAFNKFPKGICGVLELCFQAILLTVYRLPEFSNNSLGESVVFWNYDFQSILPTAYRLPELSTNSLGESVVFWNYDFQSILYRLPPTVVINQFPQGICGVLVL